MPDSSRPQRYGVVAQTFHWIIVALILTQFVLAANFGGLPPGEQQLSLIARHKSFGMTILMLAALRLLWRLNNPPPPLPEGMPIQRVLAKANHFALYFLLFAMPFSGWLMSAAKGYPVSWFGIFTWPNLIGPGAKAAGVFEKVHGLCAALLLLSVLLHVLAALKHHFWNKDGVLLRMLPFARTRKTR